MHSEIIYRSFNVFFVEKKTKLDKCFWAHKTVYRSSKLPEHVTANANKGAAVVIMVTENILE